MSIIIRRATKQDVPAMLDVFFSAFSSSALNQRCFPRSDPTVQTFWSSWIDKNIGADDDEATHMLVAEESSSGSGSGSDILGWARWVRKPVPSPPVTLSPAMYPPAGDPDLAARFFQANVDATADIVGGEAHWFLSIIVTAPEAQRRGVGSALMRFGVEKADDEGWMAYVNSSAEGRALYERFGFAVVGTSEFEELGMVQFHMRREAKKTSD
ncbi:hypothetical protein ACJ41O_004778 [Fusarium nematophilum]